MMGTCVAIGMLRRWAQLTDAQTKGARRRRRNDTDLELLLPPLLEVRVLQPDHLGAHARMPEGLLGPAHVACGARARGGERERAAGGAAVVSRDRTTTTITGPSARDTTQSTAASERVAHVAQAHRNNEGSR